MHLCLEESYYSQHVSTSSMEVTILDPFHVVLCGSTVYHSHVLLSTCAYIPSFLFAEGHAYIYTVADALLI